MEITNLKALHRKAVAAEQSNRTHIHQLVDALAEMDYHLTTEAGILIPADMVKNHPVASVKCKRIRSENVKYVCLIRDLNLALEARSQDDKEILFRSDETGWIENLVLQAVEKDIQNRIEAAERRAGNCIHLEEPPQDAPYGKLVEWRNMKLITKVLNRCRGGEIIYFVPPAKEQHVREFRPSSDHVMMVFDSEMTASEIIEDMKIAKGKRLEPVQHTSVGLIDMFVFKQQIEQVLAMESGSGLRLVNLNNVNESPAFIVLTKSEGVDVAEAALKYL